MAPQTAAQKAAASHLSYNKARKRGDLPPALQAEHDAIMDGAKKAGAQAARLQQAAADCAM